MINLKINYSEKIFKNLTKNFVKKNGRNNQGSITVRHKGGGLKKRYLLIDYTKYFMNIKGIVLLPELYDSQHSSFISLILYKTGIFSLVLKPRLLKQGDIIHISQNFILGMGNSFPLRVVPDGIFMYTLEYNSGEFAKLGRAAGSCVYIINKFAH